MKRICLFVIMLAFVLSAPVLLAAEQTLSCDGKTLLKEKDAAELLKKIQGAYRDLTSLKANFVQYSYLAALDVSEVSKGEVSFKRPGMMRWDYNEPDPQTFLVSGNTFWFYQPEDEQVTIDTFEKMLLTDLPISFLMGLGDVSKDFSVLRGCLADNQHWLELKPAQETKREEKEELKGFALAVSQKTHLPLGAMVTHVGGNKTTVMFDEYSANTEIKDSFFELQYPQGVDVIDRRSNKSE